MGGHALQVFFKKILVFFYPDVTKRKKREGKSSLRVLSGIGVINPNISIIKFNTFKVYIYLVYLQ